MEGSKRERESHYSVIIVLLIYVSIRFIAENDCSAVAVEACVVRRVSRIVAMYGYNSMFVRTRVSYIVFGFPLDMLRLAFHRPIISLTGVENS